MRQEYPEAGELIQIIGAKFLSLFFNIGGKEDWLGKVERERDPRKFPYVIS